MSTVVRSHSKINLGLAIGPARADGFHSLLTLYQTLALHDRVTVTAAHASETTIEIVANHPGVPTDERNTAWKMVAAALSHLSVTAQVSIEIDKRLPVQGGLGAGSANAAAALLGLERELGVVVAEDDRLRLAAAIGSDVPLFLLGGTVLGSDRGQQVRAIQDLTVGGTGSIPCVLAVPGVGVSTPRAFRDLDTSREQTVENLQNSTLRDKIRQLSCIYSSVFDVSREDDSDRSGTSGIFQDSCSLNSPEKLHGRSGEQLHRSLATPDGAADGSGIKNDRAENSLLALVRTGIENDFETVVFPQYPLLREIKRQLMGVAGEQNAAFYAALSGSGSALFGLYKSLADAQAAQRRVQQQGVRAIVTSTMPRTGYWSEMFAE